MFAFFDGGVPVLILVNHIEMVDAYLYAVIFMLLIINYWHFSQPF